MSLNWRYREFGKAEELERLDFLAGHIGNLRAETKQAVNERDMIVNKLIRRAKLMKRYSPPDVSQNPNHAEHA